MKIRIRINEDGALRNQRFAFSDRFTLVSELLQNARRAGASLIQIQHDAEARTLRVQDDGAGIEDFQKLLTFHESGWDDATCQEERPFGVGFTKCLYAATHCTVASRGHRIDFDTENALARASIDVQRINEHASSAVDGSMERGTRVQLQGVDLPDLAQRIQTLCRGFEVPVEFNGQMLIRPDAKGALHFVRTTIGEVHLVGTLNGEHSTELQVYLQGFCVMRRPSYPLSHRVNVIHLDPKEFMARLPDRDTLIDADKQEQRIRVELRALWREVLLERKAELLPERFVADFYAVMRSWSHLDLLDDVDVLPAESCEAVVGYPIQVDSTERSYLQTMTRAPARQDIESGKVTLVSVEEIGEDNAGRWMYARAKGLVVFSPYLLGPTHWVQAHVRYLDDEDVTVEPIGVQASTTLEGRWVWPELQLCRSVRVTVGGDAVEITDAGVYSDGRLYIPEGETSGDAVRQASNFIDSNEQFREDDLEADREALADLIRLLRSVNPKDTLNTLLAELRLEKYPLLHGKAFRVTVGQVAGEHAIELID
ncbi:ATP-binding protein [Sphaerotilus sp.]|uniref:ATP-binding protein n=1 Tax=Sphaerotilus sp. TaxID=2093942 RepID=UPI002ACD481A|nr:ATP-binding protein [Sphaerotilus sp.]MDZ7855919.1 ATP-binding protein [Sphaerotilus sp.]